MPSGVGPRFLSSRSTLAAGTALYSMTQGEDVDVVLPFELPAVGEVEGGVHADRRGYRRPARFGLRPPGIFPGLGKDQ